MKHYEIYLATGSNAIVRETLKEATAIAKEWSTRYNDRDVLVVKVEETLVKSFRQGRATEL